MADNWSMQLPESTRRILEAARSYGQRRLAEEEPNGFPRWMDEPECRVLRSNPYALFVALSLNGQIRADDAWRAPQRLADRGVVLDPKWVANHPQDVRRAVATRPVIHRYKNDAALWILRGAERLVHQYGGDATAIWRGNPHAIDVYTRFQAFPGIGSEKAAFAVGFLVESMRVQMRGLGQAPVKVDVHLRRVCMRAGISPSGEPSEIRSATQAFSPEFPFRVDRGLWFIGQTFCHERAPNCSPCPLAALCPKVTGTQIQRLTERSRRTRVSSAPDRPAKPSTSHRGESGGAVVTSSPNSRTQREIYDPRARRARSNAGLAGGYPIVPHHFQVGDCVRLVEGRHAGTEFRVIRLEPWNSVGPITLWREHAYAHGNRKYLQAFPQELAVG
jgi:uncharacterized HhH-GPD family protein